MPGSFQAVSEPFPFLGRHLFPSLHHAPLRLVVLACGLGRLLQRLDLRAIELEALVERADFLFGLDGMRVDPVTKLNRTVERLYEPSTGRWLSQDPSNGSGTTSTLSSLAKRVRTYSYSPGW